MRLLYNLGILAYGIAIRVAALRVRKARLMVAGRRGWRGKLRARVGDGNRWIWFHCASLGEFEQGRPLIEAMRAQYPGVRILLTFFSPSGYEIRKDYAHADYVCYLPLDSPRNARDFIQILRPRLAVFVKYELWLNLLGAAAEANVPVVMVSMILRPESRFFKSALRSAYRKALGGMAWIFTQDSATGDLLRAFAGHDRISTAGDARFDRVAQLPAQFKAVALVEQFIGGRTCIVVGSAWPKDEEIVLPAVDALRDLGLCWIVAPHEIDAARIARLVLASGSRMVRYSRPEEVSAGAEVLWIDNVGMLSRLYHYAAMAYIGGGFGSGIHNTQEAAVYGCPVVFGPNYQKFQEAVDMMAWGGAASVNNAEDLVREFRNILENPGLLAQTRAANRAYMQGQAGATNSILTQLDSLGFLDF